MKNNSITKLKLFLIILPALLLTQKAFSQITTCPCSGSANICVTTAQGLLDALTLPVPQPGQIIDICGIINLGELDPDKFPLVVPIDVTLQGNYNFYNYNKGVNTGTTINFPYLYKDGKQCINQLRGPGDFLPDYIDEDGNYVSQNATNSLANSQTPSKDAFVFWLEEDAQLKNICLAGPKIDTREQYMSDVIPGADCNGGTPPPSLQPIQGLMGGIYMEGKNSKIQYCEIYGFPYYGVEVYPDVTDYGIVYIDQCYIHNNKGWGFGYGVWHTAGSSHFTCDFLTQYCTILNGGVPQPTLLDNSPDPDEVLELKNTVFFENGKDFDRTGNRNSVFMDHCTFNERVLPNAPVANINAHQNTDVCNPFPIQDIGLCPVTPTLLNPHPNARQACNLTIKEAGGNVTSIANSLFYRSTNNITISYPNIYDPQSLTSPCSTAATPFGTLTPLVLIGADPILAPLHENYFINPNLMTTNRIEIAKTDLQYFDSQDQHIKGSNIFVPDATTAPAPLLQFRTFHPATGATNDPHLLIGKGDIVEFGTFGCRDANNPNYGMNTDMLYMWRFHEQPYDLTDEIRTASLGATYGLTHKFDNVGITNVNLMAIDINHNFAGSNIVKQQITVAPPKQLPGYPAQVILVVNIKDTYDGRHLIDNEGCFVDRSDLYNDGIAKVLQHNPIDHTPTGFEKFIKINGSVVWVEDVAKDKGGWQRIEMNIADLICTDGNGLPTGCTQGQQDVIEIGIQVNAQKGADATMARGISLYVDDVYIQSTAGYNALANGDFEQYNGTQAANWALTGTTMQYSYPCNGVPQPPINLPTTVPAGKLNRDEVRSGQSAFMKRIPSVVTDKYTKNAVPVPVNPYYLGIRYEAGNYSGIEQSFDVQAPPPPRMADTTEVLTNPGFTLQPNPATFNTAINGLVTQLPPNESYNLKVIAPDGAVIYNNTGAGHAFKFNASFPPGVYFVNIQSKSYTGFKKLVVVK